MKLRHCQQLKLIERCVYALRRELIGVRHLLASSRRNSRKRSSCAACRRSSCTRSCWRAPATNYARVEGAEDKATELADGLADPKQRISVNDDRESVALEKFSGLRQNLRDVEKASLDARHECSELRSHLKSFDTERTRSAGELEDARVRVARHDESNEEEQLERNERKRQVVADSIALLEYTLHAADAERAWQHERLVGWLLFR